ncbi:MAG: DUF1080 domain-containing protein [Mariniblastus sp.]
MPLWGWALLAVVSGCQDGPNKQQAKSSGENAAQSETAQEPTDAKTPSATAAAKSDSNPGSAQSNETGEKTRKSNENPNDKPAALKFGEPVNLLAKDSLDGWETLNFGGEGDCDVDEGVLTMEAGDPLTGLSSTLEDLPKTNYEISLEARKMDGTDFFCGLTFPVADSHCSLIVGGWGGTLVGLSCIDDADASRNETKLIRKFESEQWYKIRVRVQPESISVWIDDEQVIDQNIVGKKIGLRNEVDLTTPLGLCAFQTISEIKNVHLRRIVEASKKETEQPGADQPNSNQQKTRKHLKQNES